MDWQSPTTFSSPSANGAPFMARSWICNCDAAVSRQSFWEAAQRTWASSRPHDRHGNTAMPSFLPKMPRAPCPPKCTTLLSATSFQGSAGSPKVLISRFLKPDSAAVHVFIHTASVRSLGSSDRSFGSVCLLADMVAVACGPSAWFYDSRHPRRKWGRGHPCAATAFRLRPGDHRLHDSARSYVHHYSFLSASVAAVSRHQLLGHRCQLLVGLAHQQVPHFAGNNGYLGIIAWSGANHDGDGRCLRR